jgi:hypothetical protein
VRWCTKARDPGRYELRDEDHKISRVIEEVGGIEFLLNGRNYLIARWRGDLFGESLKWCRNWRFSDTRDDTHEIAISRAAEKIAILILDSSDCDCAMRCSWLWSVITWLFLDLRRFRSERREAWINSQLRERVVERRREKETED